MKPEARRALWDAREAEIAASADRLNAQLQAAVQLGCVLGGEGLSEETAQGRHLTRK